MKLKTHYIILIIAFFITVSASAQVDRRIAREQYKRAKNKTKKTDFVQQSVDYLTKELTLDSFQKAAVQNIIEEERDEITALRDATGITIDEIKDRARAISDRIYKKVLPLLSKEQAEKYTKMEESKKF